MDSDATARPLPFFVYGTLMLGHPNDALWQDRIYSHETAFFARGCLYDLGYYPTLTEEPLYVIKGQLICVKDECFEALLPQLDHLEGYNPEHPEMSHYHRRRCHITTNSSAEVEAWAYFGKEQQVQGLPVVEGGDWAAYIAGSEEAYMAWWQAIRSVWDDNRQSGDSGR